MATRLASELGGLPAKLVEFADNAEKLGLAEAWRRASVGLTGDELKLLAQAVALLIAEGAVPTKIGEEDVVAEILIDAGIPEEQARDLATVLLIQSLPHELKDVLADGGEQFSKDFAELISGDPTTFRERLEEFRKKYGELLDKLTMTIDNQDVKLSDIIDRLVPVFEAADRVGEALDNGDLQGALDALSGLEEAVRKAMEGVGAGAQATRSIISAIASTIAIAALAAGENEIANRAADIAEKYAVDPATKQLAGAVKTYHQASLDDKLCLVSVVSNAVECKSPGALYQFADAIAQAGGKQVVAALAVQALPELVSAGYLDAGAAIHALNDLAPLLGLPESEVKEYTEKLQLLKEAGDVFKLTREMEAAASEEKEDISELMNEFAKQLEELPSVIERARQLGYADIADYLDTVYTTMKNEYEKLKTFAEAVVPVAQAYADFIKGTAGALEKAYNLLQTALDHMPDPGEIRSIAEELRSTIRALVDKYLEEVNRLKTGPKTQAVQEVVNDLLEKMPIAREAAAGLYVTLTELAKVAELYKTGRLMDYTIKDFIEQYAMDVFRYILGAIKLLRQDPEMYVDTPLGSPSIVLGLTSSSGRSKIAELLKKRGIVHPNLEDLNKAYQEAFAKTGDHVAAAIEVYNKYKDKLDKLTMSLGEFAGSIIHLMNGLAATILTRAVMAMPGGSGQVHKLAERFKELIGEVDVPRYGPEAVEYDNIYEPWRGLEEHAKSPLSWISRALSEVVERVREGAQIRAEESEGIERKFHEIMGEFSAGLIEFFSRITDYAALRDLVLALANIFKEKGLGGIDDAIKFVVDALYKSLVDLGRDVFMRLKTPRGWASLAGNALGAYWAYRIGKKIPEFVKAPGPLRARIPRLAVAMLVSTLIGVPELPIVSFVPEVAGKIASGLKFTGRRLADIAKRIAKGVKVPVPKLLDAVRGAIVKPLEQLKSLGEQIREIPSILRLSEEDLRAGLAELGQAGISNIGKWASLVASIIKAGLGQFKKIKGIAGYVITREGINILFTDWDTYRKLLEEGREIVQLGDMTVEAARFTADTLVLPYSIPLGFATVFFQLPVAKPPKYIIDIPKMELTYDEVVKTLENLANFVAGAVALPALAGAAMAAAGAARFREAVSI